MFSLYIILNIKTSIINFFISLSNTICIHCLTFFGGLPRFYALSYFACKRKPFCLQAHGLLLISERSFACSQKLQNKHFCTSIPIILHRNLCCFVPQLVLFCIVVFAETLTNQRTVVNRPTIKISETNCRNYRNSSVIAEPYS